ncbi:heat shock factor protein 2-like [Alligator sinensis]|uniref:Heat shock factor protein 2-like n=1 Tax=Alligator sinensis TaxID=38654 RepID=A0A1U8DJ60_ALLSI|nr:heat shock factor protein 2-like [Alligator sinensis]
MKPGGGGSAGGAVPQFLSKVWALVEDPATDDFIGWSPDGQSFQVLDEESFAKRILPRHFKHNNMASFVRQLNWYGFHKVIQSDIGPGKQERYSCGKYQHPFFRKGQQELLSKIKRKVPLPRIENGKIGPEEVHKILAIVHQMQGKQDVLDSTLESLKRENEALWKEVLDLRQKQIQHQQLCETNIASQSCSQIIGLPQKQPFTIDSTGNYNQQSTQELVDKNQTFKNSCNVSGSKDNSEVRSSIIIKEEYPGSLEDESQPQRRTEIKFNKTQVLKCQNLVNQEHETEQATDTSEFDTETEDCRSTCSDSGHVEKRRKVRHSTSQKTEQLFIQMHKESVGLTERLLALEEQSLQKLSEISSTLSTLASCVIKVENPQQLSQLQGVRTQTQGQTS